MKKNIRLFNIKIETQDKQFNNFFNFYLPRRILIEGVLGGEAKDASIEEIKNAYKQKQISAYDCYISIKNNFIRETNDFYQFMFNSNYRLKLFFDEKTKIVNVQKGEKQRLVVDGINYFNLNSISKKACYDCKEDIFIFF